MINGKAAAWVGALLVAGLAADARAEWSLIEKKDAFTDKVTREVCSLDESKNQICFVVHRDGPRASGPFRLWATYSLSKSETRGMEFEKYPLIRIDANETHDPNPLIDLEKTVKIKIIPREFHAEWAAWSTQIFNAESTPDNPKGVFHQLVTGKKMLIRYFLTGGYQKDTAIPLDGIAVLLLPMKPGAPW